MTNLEAANNRERGSSRHHLALALCVLACALIPTLTSAQLPSERVVTILKSGLHSIFTGHSFLLTVAEVGSVSSESEVTIEFRDAADQRRAFTSGTLVRNRPVRLRVPIAADARREQLRVIVRIVAIANPGGSEPVVGLEDIDDNSFTIETKPPCAPVPSMGGGAEGNCDGGWRVSHSLD